MTALRVENLSKEYAPGKSARVQALMQVSLQVEARQMLVLLGPSGSGKTTLLRLIAGLELPAAGEIYLQDKNVTRLSPAERNVSMVFQQPALLPHLTVRENIRLALTLRKAARPDERLQQAVEPLGLSALMNRYPETLSGGQQQRVALARALVTEPALLLLDEPLASLDATARGELRTFIRRALAQTGTPAIYVTHDQTEAMLMNTTIALLQKGTVAQIGSASELYRRPASLFVAQFFGDGVNLLPKNGRMVAFRPRDIVFRAGGEWEAEIVEVVDIGGERIVKLLCDSTAITCRSADESSPAAGTMIRFDIVRTLEIPSEPRAQAD